MSLAALCLFATVAAAVVTPAVASDGRPAQASLSVQVASTAPASRDAGKSASLETLDPLALVHARTIRREITARWQTESELVVTEASSTAVVESFTLLTASLDETRVVAADNGIYFAICPRGARCPYPALRFARSAGDFLPRRQALELALRTFLETSANVVAVSLPTRRFILFIVERDELAREVDMSAVAEALNGDPSQALAAWVQRIVDQVTRPRVFVFLGLEPTPSGRDTFAAIARWPSVDAGGVSSAAMSVTAEPSERAFEGSRSAAGPLGTFSLGFRNEGPFTALAPSCRTGHAVDLLAAKAVTTVLGTAAVALQVRPATGRKTIRLEIEVSDQVGKERKIVRTLELSETQRSRAAMRAADARPRRSGNE